MTRQLLLGLSALALAACDGADTEEDAEVSTMQAETEASAAAMQEEGPTAEQPILLDDPDGTRITLREAVAGSWRSDADRARDEFRNPEETLEFFGVEPSDTVVEVWPGGGWYTDIIAPYLAGGGGELYLAGFPEDSDNPRVRQAVENLKQRFSDEDQYGDVNFTVLTSEEQDIAPAGSADVVLTFRNIHNFVMGGWGDDAFAAFYDALKPGGTLGVVDHRLPEDADKEREMSSGYLKVATVRELAENAGFVFDGSSEINANPDDDTDHPFGVWTLPPNSRTQDRNGEAPEGFDPEEYRAIGESDRMTLRFTKPVEPEESLLE
jgi:predicted methyltransferase